MTAGSIPVPTVVPLRVPAAGESKFNINTNTRVELRSVVPASENVSIHYTINGTRPDPFNRSNHLHKSTFMYLGPFTLPAGKIVLKALACLPDGKESGVNTKTLHVTFVEPDESVPSKLEDNDISFRKIPQQCAPKASLTQSMNSSLNMKSGGSYPFPMEVKDPIITQNRKSAPVQPKFLTGSVKPMSDLSYEINTNTNYPNIFGDYVPKNPQTAMRISRETDFLRCICCFAPRPADPSAKFCHECGYPVSPLTEKQLPPPEPGQMGQCIKCQSTVPLNTQKCVVCEFDLAEQFQPQATLRTAEKKKCAECFSFNPPSVAYCLKCEARLDDVSVVKIRNNIEKPPPNTSTFLGGDETMVTCSKCGRVNSADARFCDWCGSKPKKTNSFTSCLKCTAANEPYARFCSTCGAVMEAPERLDPRNTGKLMSGMSIKDAIKSLDSRATAAWLPMTAPAAFPAKKQTSTVQTQTVGLFYPSTKTLEKYLAEDETRKVFKEEKKIPLSGVSPGKGYWRQNVDFITNHLKAHTQNDTDFRKLIGEPKLGKLMSATIHEDGHEFSLVLNFPIRSNKEHPDPFKGKNLSISKSTVVGVYPNLLLSDKGGKAPAGLSDDESDETEPSDVETAMSSFISQKDKDLIGNTKQKIKTRKKKSAVLKGEKKGDWSGGDQLSAANRLLFAQLGPGGDGDVEIVKQLLSEQDVSPDSVNSKGESILVLAVKNQRKDCIRPVIDAGADVNRKVGPSGNTPLHEAVFLGNNGQSIVETLLSGGANPNRKNDKGQTPYSIATEKGYENIITALAVNMGQDMLHKIAQKSNSHEIDDMVY